MAVGRSRRPLPARQPRVGADHRIRGIRTARAQLPRDHASDDLERDLALVEALLTGERESYTLEKRYLRRDGRAVWVLLPVAIVRDTAGRPLHFTAQMVDISARWDHRAGPRRGRAVGTTRSKAAASASGDWNAETDRIFYSPRWKEMLGYADDEIGDTLDEWEQRLHPEDREAVHAALKLHYAGGTDYYEAEYRLRCRDGGWKWILDRGQVLERDADGGKSALSRLRHAPTSTSAKSTPRLALAGPVLVPRGRRRRRQERRCS